MVLEGPYPPHLTYGLRAITIPSYAHLSENTSRGADREICRPEVWKEEREGVIINQIKLQRQLSSPRLTGFITNMGFKDGLLCEYPNLRSNL